VPEPVDLSEKNQGSERVAGRDSEATSDDTLSDIEENEADVASDSSSSAPEPSPDGALEEPDDPKDTGPM
jgi:hypothetical protein